MANFNDISDLFDFERYFQGCEPEFHSDASSPAPDPLLPPDSPLSESSSSTLTDSTNPSSSPLTDEEDAHYDNVIFYGIDSPILPYPPATHMTEMSMTLVSTPPPFAASPSITDVSIASDKAVASSPRTSFSPTASPPVLKRRRSMTEESNESQPGPSTSRPRPAKQPRLSVPGESAFQVDMQVPAFTSSSPPGPPMGRTRQRVDYSACKCRNRTSKPARHWKTACPYNPNRHTNRVPCEICGMTFTRHDNMDRHMEDYH